MTLVTDLIQITHRYKSLVADDLIEHPTHPLPAHPPPVPANHSIMMGKCKKNLQNVMKVDLGDCKFKRGEILPVRVQQSSKDGHHMEQTVHKIPMPQNNPPPLLPSTPPQHLRPLGTTHFLRHATWWMNWSVQNVYVRVFSLLDVF